MDGSGTRSDTDADTGKVDRCEDRTPGLGRVWEESGREIKAVKVSASEV